MRAIPCLVLFVSAAGCSGGGSPPPAAGSRPSQAANANPNVGEFQEVYNAYASNPSDADAQYGGRVIEGVLRVDAADVSKDKARLTQYTALTGDTVETLRPDPSKGVTATFDDPGPVAAVKTGSRLKIRCEVEGYADGVLTLRGCQVVETLPPAAGGKGGGRFRGADDKK